MTSMLKKVDVAVFDTPRRQRGNYTAGRSVRPQGRRSRLLHLRRLRRRHRGRSSRATRKQIISGEIRVPTHEVTP